MGSIAFEQAVAAVACRAGEDSALWSTGQRMEQIEAITTLERMLPAMRHQLINELAGSATVAELGGSLPGALADRVRISRTEARRWVAEAADLGPRTALTGEPLAARLAATAAAQSAGQVGAEAVRIIRGFFDRLPYVVDEAARVKAEQDLAEVAAGYRPDQLKNFAEHLDLCLNPDGNFTDADRARRRGITVGPQGPDGMSPIKGWLTPEARAGWDAVAAKLAAPGMCNPADEHPTVTGTPSQDAIRDDVRSAAQRHHDAVNTLIRSTLTSGMLGKHQGVPVTITVTAELEALQAKTGMARTGGGTLLPIKDVIRMAANAHHYLLLFDKAQRIELYKGRTTRLATKEQRLVLYALERGCTRPGCDAPPYWCQVHHANTDWAKGGQTNIDELTLACPPDNRLVDDDSWRTRKRKDATEWIPPPELDQGQPRTNTYFHPEKMLPDEDDDEP